MAKHKGFFRGKNIPRGSREVEKPYLRPDQVLVYMNALGGPRTVGESERVDLRDPTSDGKTPKFVTMGIVEAQGFLHANEQGGREAHLSLETLKQMDGEIVGIKVPAISHLTLADHARVETIRRRILAGARRKQDVLKDDDAEWCDERGIEFEVNWYVPAAVQPVAKPKDRREATLADQLLASNDPMLLDRKLFENLKKGLRQSPKFVLTAAAAQRIGDAIHAYPELLVDNSDFAIPPYPNCWIEVPAQVLNKAVTPTGDFDEGDFRTGYLIADNTVWVAGADATGCSFSPLSIELHEPRSLEDEADLCRIGGISRFQLDAVAWGATLFRDLPQAYRRGLRERHGMWFTPAPQYLEEVRERQLILSACAGEMRNIVGILLALNQPGPVIERSHVDRHKRMTAKGYRTLAEHTTVNIHLDRLPIQRLLTRPQGEGHASPRWHQVRGHFCHDKAGRGLTGCDHEGGNWWVETAPRKWECLECGGKRWWRELPNGRGDIAKGRVTHDHVVDA